MKSISFDAESRAAIERGDKTVTRRLVKGKPCRYRVGETLYVSERWRQPEKDAKQFVEVVSVSREPLHDMRDGEAYREGYPRMAGVSMERWWKARWNSIHTEPGTRFEDNPEVYRIEFRVVKS